MLYAIPTEGIFSGETICLFSRFIGTECWGCGITRAIFSVLYGEFTQAWEYNRLIVLVFPLLLWLWCKEVRDAVKRVRESGRT